MASSKYWNLPKGSYARVSKDGKKVTIHSKGLKQTTTVFRKLKVR